MFPIHDDRPYGGIEGGRSNVVPVRSMGNSLSLSGVCGRSTQSPLPRAARGRHGRREGARYRETHVAGAFSAAQGKPLSARCAHSGAPRGVVLHAVSTRSATPREFGRGECALGWEWYGEKQFFLPALHGSRLRRSAPAAATASAAPSQATRLCRAPARRRRGRDPEGELQVHSGVGLRMACGRGEAPLRSLRSLRRPQSGRRSATPREFGRRECAMWEIAAY